MRGRHGTRGVLTAELGVSERTSWSRPGELRQQSWVLVRGRHGTRGVLTAELGVSERTSWSRPGDLRHESRMIQCGPLETEQDDSVWSAGDRAG